MKNIGNRPVKERGLLLKARVYENKIGFPLLLELNEKREIPGIGEYISLNIQPGEKKRCEVTEVKRDLSDGVIEIYVNTT